MSGQFDPSEYLSQSRLDALDGRGPSSLEEVREFERAAMVANVMRKRDRPAAHPLLRHHLRNLLGRWVIPLSITYLGFLGLLVWWLFQIAGRKP